MHLELLVGSRAFWERARADIAAARERVLIQAMTFEGDTAGSAVAQAVRESGAADRRVLVDDYTRHVINDRLLASPFAGKGARAEAKATRAMFAGLVAAGIGIRVTNPLGANPLRYAVRNHKKLIVADDVAYLGGINFSDHNFAWHDLMLRIESRPAAEFLADDFAATWGGAPAASHADFGGLQLFALDGRNNAAGFTDVFALLDEARESIDLVSAYPTFPFIDSLGEAAARGVDVDIFTPLPNNKPLVRDYLFAAAQRQRIAIRLLPKMTHLKGLLVDNRALVLGSSNFDFVSHRVEEEIVAVVREGEVIHAFREQVLTPARAEALSPDPHRPPRWRSAQAGLALRCADAIVKRMRGTARGAADWA